VPSHTVQLFIIRLCRVVAVFHWRLSALSLSIRLSNRYKSFIMSSIRWFDWSVPTSAHLALASISNDSKLETSEPVGNIIPWLAQHQSLVSNPFQQFLVQQFCISLSCRRVESIDDLIRSAHRIKIPLWIRMIGLIVFWIFEADY